MSLPKRRISRARGRKRRAANMRLTVPTLVECGNCGNRVMPHRVCPKCGYYRGKQVLKPEEMA
jgi:large subunit ribosomal protein L32